MTDIIQSVGTGDVGPSVHHGVQAVVVGAWKHFPVRKPCDCAETMLTPFSALRFARTWKYVLNPHLHGSGPPQRGTPYAFN